MPARSRYALARTASTTQHPRTWGPGPRRWVRISALSQPDSSGASARTARRVLSRWPEGREGSSDGEDRQADQLRAQVHDQGDDRSREPVTHAKRVRGNDAYHSPRQSAGSAESNTTAQHSSSW
jgi:hypothetical protein